MIVWYILSLFYLFCQNPMAMVFAILSGFLLFLAVNLPKGKRGKQ